MFADFYASQMADVDYKQIYEFIKPHLNVNDVILDAGCGPGYLLKELIDNGHNAIGIDNDDAMLSIATNEQELYGLVFNHDLRNALGNNFDLIISVFDVVNYFKGIKGVFQNIYRSLNKNGTFIFDIYNKDALRKMRGFFEFSKNYEWETWMEKEVIHHNIKTTKNQFFEIKQYGYKLKYYTDMLTAVGFTYEVINGPDLRKHYIIARKNGK